jgi:hypothetical protein
MHKLNKPGLLYFRYADEEKSENEENFESLVDLFTLISIALIISTFIYGYQRREVQANNLQAMIEFREVESGEGIPIGIPAKTLIMLHTIQNDKDVIFLLESKKNPKRIFESGQKKSLLKSLEENKSTFIAANEIQLLVDSTAGEINAKLLLTYQNWFSKYQLKVNLSFNGDVD